MYFHRVIIVSVCIVLCAASFASAGNKITNSYALNSQALLAMKNAHVTLQTPMQVVKSSSNISKDLELRRKQFIYEPDLPKDTLYTYIIQLSEPAVAQEPRALSQISSQKQQTNRVNKQRGASSTQNEAVSKQMAKILHQQQGFLDQSAAQVFTIKPLARYQYGINGMAVRLTQAQAQRLSELKHVKNIQREQIRKLNADRGPMLIGAPKVWDGTAFPGVGQTSGEGIVIGIIDSGINTDHPSFAEVAGDGYIHTNPRGNGNYLGDCARNFPELCNNKLIGVYSYTDITNDYSDTSVFPPNLPRNGEDYGGHGSHVASIAAGNILLNVDEVTPSEGEERSSGTPTGFIFAQVSGVAPRANIISYQVCYGGTKEAGDFYGDCKESAILKAIDDAIKDKVDVINFSISGGNNPWLDPVEQALLSARNAGIFVAVSAGNDGPEALSSEKTAPWYTSVAASEHGRENLFIKQLGSFSGGSSTLNAMPGQSNTGSLTAAIVYAGSFINPNDPGGDPAQCLEPFPNGTFNGQIVVCDRGNIARIQKAMHVRDGGAGGYVLVNVDGGETFLASDQYVIPGIHLNANNGNNLKDWLRSGRNHSASISPGVPSQVIDTSRVDVMANYSSRGPNKSISTLVPTITAPGSRIFAAYADEQLGHDGQEPAASNFSTIDGTSMSSPHVAGSAALIKSAKPNWGPDEIRSAMALTAITSVKKDDETSTRTIYADFFDMGSGRVQVDKAIASPLIMSETSANYADADPDRLGEPRSLNLPSITDNRCAGICTWSRTFTATTDAAFDYEQVVISPALRVEATPSRFTLLTGQSQRVSFSINSLQASKTDYSFALARFTSPGLPDVSLPVSILSSIGNFPLSIDISARRSNDSFLIKDIDAISIENFELKAYKPVKANSVKSTIGADSDTSSYLDNVNEGVNITQVRVMEGAKRLVTRIKKTSSRDIDLFVLFDADDNGTPSLIEEIARSVTTNYLDEIHINYPKAGTYFIAVQNYLPSNDSPDTFEMRYAIVTNEVAGSSLNVEAPSRLESDMPFDLRVIYDLPQSQSGEDYYGAVGMGTGIGEEDIGLLNIDITRVDNDVFIDGIATRLRAGERTSLNVTVEANPSNEARDYRITLPIPVGVKIVNFSTTNSGQLINNEIVWRVNKPAGSSSNTTLDFTIEALQGVLAGPIIINMKSELISSSFADTETSENFTSVQVEGAPILSFDGNDTANLTVTETQILNIPLSITEPNNDDIIVSFLQTAGPAVSITTLADSYTLLAPAIESDTQLRYTVTATDTNGNSSTGAIVINVVNNASPIISSVNAPISAIGGDSITISVVANDPENDTLFIQINGRDVTGTSVNLTTPTVGNNVSYVVSVSDGVTAVEQTITVSLNQIAAFDPSSGGGGSLAWWIIYLFPLAILRRVRKC